MPVPRDVMSASVFLCVCLDVCKASSVSKDRHIIVRTGRCVCVCVFFFFFFFFFFFLTLID